MPISLLHLKFAMAYYSFASSELAIDGMHENLSISSASQSWRLKNSRGTQ